MRDGCESGEGWNLDKDFVESAVLFNPTESLPKKLLKLPSLRAVWSRLNMVD